MALALFGAGSVAFSSPVTIAAGSHFTRTPGPSMKGKAKNQKKQKYSKKASSTPVAEVQVAMRMCTSQAQVATVVIVLILTRQWTVSMLLSVLAHDPKVIHGSKDMLNPRAASQGNKEELQAVPQVDSQEEEVADILPDSRGRLLA